MMRIDQYYSRGGFPVDIEGDPTAPAAAWRSHRRRLREWLGDLPDEQWGRPTRCDEWDVLHLVRHLASGSQFLGYTLHMAAKGQPTTRLRAFDSQTTAQDRAEDLGVLDPSGARQLLQQMDQRTEEVMSSLSLDDWTITAEAPPGHMPAFMAVSHFVFDSWLHERDLLLPGGERPVTEQHEASVAARYGVGLMGAYGSDQDDPPLGVRLTDIDLELRLEQRANRWQVLTGSGPVDASVEGRAGDVLDRATGRAADGVSGDGAGLRILETVASIMAA